MSILIPVVDTGITFSEIPNHIAFYVEIGECTQKCRGCHSPELCCAVEEKTDLEDLLYMAEEAVDKGANAILLLGGTSNSLNIRELLLIIDALADIAPVCLYSGVDTKELNDYIAFNSNLTWIKTGSYKEELGGLSSPMTNQRFYRKENEYTVFRFTIAEVKPILVDYTHAFQTCENC